MLQSLLQISQVSEFVDIYLWPLRSDICDVLQFILSKETKDNFLVSFASQLLCFIAQSKHSIAIRSESSDEESENEIEDSDDDEEDNSTSWIEYICKRNLFQTVYSAFALFNLKAAENYYFPPKANKELIQTTNLQIKISIPSEKINVNPISKSEETKDDVEWEKEEKWAMEMSCPASKLYGSNNISTCRKLILALQFMIDAKGIILLFIFR